MPSSNPSPEFPVPVELIREIIKFLSPPDHKILSLACRLTRSQAIPFIFGHLRYTGKITPKLRNIHLARKDVKEVIRKIELNSSNMGIREDEDSAIIFQFLETLPNLKALNYRQIGTLIRPADHLSRFISSVRYAPLLELVLDTGDYAAVEGLPTAGLTGLEKLSITWRMSDNPNEPGSSLTHLYELIRPSLTTLVELRIDIKPEILGADFDLQLLKPAADTLQTFEYTLQSSDENILDAIPKTFPHLRRLGIKWDDLGMGHSVVWKDAHIDALSKNNNLTDLTLSSDFEVSAEDTVTATDDVAWYVRCYKRRLKATQDIASACPRLRRCSWVQMGIAVSKMSSMLHPFIVEERVSGSNVTRVVRGLKQDWMGRDHKDWPRGGGVVKCRLEDLPGDIVGYNDVEYTPIRLGCSSSNGRVRCFQVMLH